MGAYGETHFVLYRKDRVRFLKGGEHFRDFRLQPKAPTRRVITTCCNMPVFLEFQGGHWLSLYSCLWPETTLPLPALRTMTIDLPEASLLPGDVPNCKRLSWLFFVKLFSAWIAMGFRSPPIAANKSIAA